MTTPRDFPCPFAKYGRQPCGAKPGEPCTEWIPGSGDVSREVPYYHAERVDEAFADLRKRRTTRRKR